MRQIHHAPSHPSPKGRPPPTAERRDRGFAYLVRPTQSLMLRCKSCRESIGWVIVGRGEWGRGSILRGRVANSPLAAPRGLCQQMSQDHHQGCSFNFAFLVFISISPDTATFSIEDKTVFFIYLRQNRKTSYFI